MEMFFWRGGSDPMLLREGHDVFIMTAKPGQTKFSSSEEIILSTSIELDLFFFLCISDSQIGSESIFFKDPEISYVDGDPDLFYSLGTNLS